MKRNLLSIFQTKQPKLNISNYNSKHSCTSRTNTATKKSLCRSENGPSKKSKDKLITTQPILKSITSRNENKKHNQYLEQEFNKENYQKINYKTENNQIFNHISEQIKSNAYFFDLIKSKVTH